MKFLRDSGKQHLAGISEARRKKVINQHLNNEVKKRAKMKKGIQANVAEKERGYQIDKNMISRDSIKVGGWACTEGYSISELCCCLFSVLTFL